MILALCAALCSGCAGGRQAPTPPDVTSATQAIGCTARITVDSDEVREASCRTGSGQYWLNTFATANGARAWLRAAQDYGGTYLVGERWIVHAEPPTALAALREKLGGSLKSSPHHHEMAHTEMAP